MRLIADKVDTARTLITSRLNADRLSPFDVEELLSVYGKTMGYSGTMSLSKVKSTLVAGVGFINLFTVDVDGITHLKQLKLTKIKELKLCPLDAVLVEKLRVLTGKLERNTLYLLEYPDGYILSLNDLMLAFNGKD